MIPFIVCAKVMVMKDEPLNGKKGLNIGVDWPPLLHLYIMLIIKLQIHVRQIML